MNLHSLTTDGLEALPGLLESMRRGDTGDLPAGFLDDPRYVTDLGLQMDRPRAGELTSRWQLALWLFQRLDGKLPQRALFQDAGMWSWLAMFLLDVIAPKNADDRRDLQRDDAKYILRRGDYRKAYRHMIAGPFLLLRAHASNPQLLRPLLSNPPTTPGDVYEQLASRKPIVTSPGALAVIRALYWDEKKERIRPGSANKTGRGTLRRLISVLMQLDVTYDLVAAPQERLARVLPAEFGAPTTD